MRVKHCELCHDITERRVAPPFRMIALFYAKADREAIAKKLEKKIVHGGGGTWGSDGASRSSTRGGWPSSICCAR